MLRFDPNGIMSLSSPASLRQPHRPQSWRDNRVRCQDGCLARKILISARSCALRGRPWMMESLCIRPPDTPKKAVSPVPKMKTFRNSHPFLSPLSLLNLKMRIAAEELYNDDICCIWATSPCKAGTTETFKYPHPDRKGMKQVKQRAPVFADKTALCKRPASRKGTRLFHSVQAKARFRYSMLWLAITSGPSSKLKTSTEI